MPEYNYRSTTGTQVKELDTAPFSGMCPICVEDCETLCEIGKAAFRGREVLYPRPDKFGGSTQSCNKDYGLDWSHFQIMADVRGAYGIPEDPDQAIFENVQIETSLGGIPLKIPVFTAALGSTAVARKYWDHIAIGSALSGTIQTIGENICGMDRNAKFTQAKVTDSPDLRHRVEAYREFWDGKYGEIVVQTNVEDQRLGVDIYALSKLEVNVIERKWGQGAKCIGGEVRIRDLEHALMLKRRGYILIPDPEDPAAQEAFKAGVFSSFERHSRIGMPKLPDFVEDIQNLREQGAKKVFIKTGAYKPAAVAFTLRCASQAKVDAVTFDGAGGGTAMSPVVMMQEWGVPTVWLEAMVLRCANILRSRGRHVPDLAIAGGFTNEAQIFKSIAMSNFGDGPLVKAIAMARAPMSAAMRAAHFSELARTGALPPEFKSLYGDRPELFFVKYDELRRRYGEKFQRIPAGAIGVYTYYSDKLAVGLKQLMGGARKFKLNLLDRTDIAALSERAARVTGIPLIEDYQGELLEYILLG